MEISNEQKDRFWSHVDRKSNNECWNWKLSKDHHGYGLTSFNSKTYRAHRIAYKLERGSIPDGMVLDHLCRNTSCVNPNHLEVVTQAVNNQRANGFSGINFRKTHCPKGHEYTAENTITKYGKGRQRICKICRTERDDGRPRKTNRRANISHGRVNT